MRRSSLRLRLPAAVALVVAVLAGSSVLLEPAASAARPAASAPAELHPLLNAAKYTVHCSSVKGAISLKQPLKLGSGPKTETATFHATLTGCKAKPTAGGSPVTVSKGSLSGSLAFPAQGGCYGLLNNVATTGKLTTAWTTTPSLSSGSTVTKVHSLAVTTLSQLDLPGSTPDSSSGSFSGTDGGASSVAVLRLPPIIILAAVCASATGLSKMTLLGGTATYG